MCNPPTVLTAVTHAITTFLLTTTLAYALSARSGLPVCTPIAVESSGNHTLCSLLVLIALAANHLLPGSYSLVAPVPTSALSLYAIFFHPNYFTLKMEALST